MITIPMWVFVCLCILALPCALLVAVAVVFVILMLVAFIISLFMGEEYPEVEEINEDIY